jgi:hypothetical protein
LSGRPGASPSRDRRRRAAERWELPASCQPCGSATSTRSRSCALDAFTTTTSTRSVRDKPSPRSRSAQPAVEERTTSVASGQLLGPADSSASVRLGGLHHLVPSPHLPGGLEHLDDRTERYADQVRDTPPAPGVRAVPCHDAFSARSTSASCPRSRTANTPACCHRGVPDGSWA